MRYLVVILMLALAGCGPQEPYPSWHPYYEEPRPVVADQQEDVTCDTGPRGIDCSKD